MKKLYLLFIFIFLFVIVGCSNDFSQYNLEYNIDLSQFPVENDLQWYGKIVEIQSGKLLVEPGGEKAKDEYGEVVWIICDETECYNTGQVVTYIYREVKAPKKEGNPLEIIALFVYME